MSESAPAEVTIRAIVLGAVLSAVLAAANAYLGLFAGMTVSAAIPAAVISMGLLRPLGGTILENNLVQTAASAGESAAAGAIFTLPAVILLGAWARFDLLLCGTLIAIGGVLGVLYTILLRRAIVVGGNLPFPEGTATAEVLRVGHQRGGDASSGVALRTLVWGSVWGALAKFIESGLGWSKSVVEGAFSLGGGVFYLGTAVSPALVAVGSIVGLEVALVVFLGGAVNWLLIVPFSVDPTATGSALEIAWATWSQKTRYVGVGAMTLGGIAALWEVRVSILLAVRAGLASLEKGTGEPKEVPLTDQDISARVIFGGILATALPVFVVFYWLTDAGGIALLLTVLVLVFGFLFSSVAAYMAGLVGSSNNPVSGVTIATILFTSLLLSWLGVAATTPSIHTAAGPAAAILVGSVVCTAAAIGGDNVQDLKAGQLLGATPYRQQWLQLLGVLVAALVLTPVLQLLADAYGFGAPTAEHPHALRAPQATLMSAVALGVFGGDLPWAYLFGGVGLGVVVLITNEVMKRRGSTLRVAPLGFALGLYLPWEMSGPIALGAALTRLAKGRKPAVAAERSGLLAGAGLITGEALMGIFLAVLVGVFQKPDFLVIGGRPQSPLLSLVIVAAALYFLATAFRSTPGSDAAPR